MKKLLAVVSVHYLFIYSFHGIQKAYTSIYINVYNLYNHIVSLVYFLSRVSLTLTVK